MRKGLTRFAAMMTIVMLLTSALPTLTLSSAESDVSFSGSFAKSKYTMTVGETLDVKVKASVTNAKLTRVTINVDNYDNKRLSSKEVNTSDWNGYLTLDASVAPLNVPGTYIIKLFAGFGTAAGEWAEVDRATLTVEEVQYDDLEVDIDVPSEVTLGDSLTARSVVSGGSGSYSYLWTWTHPDGTEMTDPRKNCSGIRTVLGTYTFTLTVTDKETGETATSRTVTVKVESPQETYDPMKVRFVGGNKEYEIELAMVGIGAECKVTGGSGDFEYGWEIECDGEILQRYSYGMVDEVCTWKADKVGVYTFRVTVKDLRTDLTESASCSVKVIQKEYDPLTLKITSAPKYADLGETVRVVAETTGGVGTVTVTWEVYLGSTRVASGTGSTAQFTANSNGEYEVIFSAEDEAQILEDRATIIAGNQVKCTLSVSSNSLYVGGNVEATATVQDGIGPFKYEWMLYRDGSFVSSELDSKNATYSWKAEQAGTYRIECTIYDLGSEEALGKMVYASDSADVTVLSNPVFRGAFGEDSYTMAVGENLPIDVSASVEGANLTRVTVTVDKSGDDDHDHMDITSGSTWSGQFTLKGNVYPLNIPGTYTIKLFAKADAGNPNWAEVDRATLTVTEAPGKLPDPVVKVEVKGMTAEVTWDAIDGAVRYVCSLHNITTDKNVFKYVAANDFCVTLNDLEPGAQYRVAIGAVPEGVTDIAVEHEKCSWGTETFTIPNGEKLPDPVVKVEVKGMTAEVTWDVIDGAVRYVCSLHNITTDKNVFKYVAASDFRVTLNDLEPNTQYRVAIGAVPEGVTDITVEHEKCSWGIKEFEILRIAKPNVTVTVDGSTMLASWEEVPGATRYVFSLRETSKPEGEPAYKHVETDGCSIMLSLEPGIEYKLAVAAVPFGVEDTEKDTIKCSWAETIFTTETLEEINTPKVLEMKTDMWSNFLLPGEKVMITVVCNKVTEYLDVYDPNYQTLKDPKFNKDGYPYFEYTLSYADVGKKELRFVALDAELNWSREKKHQGFLELIVCDHTPMEEVISTSKPVKKDHTNHTVTETYREFCLCGKINNPAKTREVDQPHKWGSLQESKTHTQGRGHRRFYQCACGEVKDHDYVSFSKTYAENKKCSTCRARYELIEELQRLLNERGYNAGSVNGIFGNDTKNAMNAFRQKVMGLPAIDDVDDATMAALRNGNVPPTPESTDDPEVAPAPVEAMEVLETLLKNEQMTDDLFNQLIKKASDYLNNGEITREQYEQFCYSVAKEHNFERVFGLETDKIQYVLNPEKGSTVGAKVLSKDIGDKLADFVGSAVFDSYVSALDPFYEEFGQTMDVLAEEFKADTEKMDVDLLDKLKLNNMIENVLTKAYGKEVAEQVLEGKKSIDSLSKDWNSVKGAFDKQEVAQAEELFKAMFGENEYFVMPYARELNIKTGEIKTTEKLIDVKTYVKGEIGEIKRKQNEVETCVVDILAEKLSSNKKGGKQITAEDISAFIGELNDIIDGVTNGADFYKLLASRMNLDNGKVIDFCDTLDNCEGLTSELNMVRKILRAEASDDPVERLGAIIAEYAMSLAVKEVGKAAVGAVETATGAAASPVYAAMKASAVACNMTMGTKGVVSNTRGMTAQYENYEAMYNNYLRLRKRYEDNPTNSKLREDARNALTLALLCNIKADEYYLEMVKSVDNSFAAKVAEVITGNVYTGLDKTKELKGMINTEIVNRNAQLELLKYGKIKSGFQAYERIEFTAYGWARITNIVPSAGERVFTDAETGKTFYMRRDDNATKFAVDGLYESVQSFFSARTVDGDVREFVELKSSTGREFIITKSAFDHVKPE